MPGRILERNVGVKVRETLADPLYARIAAAPLEPAFSDALKGALFTDPKSRNKATLKRLDLLVRKHL